MSVVSLSPYLFFGGRAEEAIEFYQSALGAQLEMKMRFDESPDPTPEGMLAPGYEKKIMHASLNVEGQRIMLSDGCSEQDGGFSGFSLALTVSTEERVREIFAALSEGGMVQMPPGPTFWSPCYGMLKDQFGLHWMIMVLTDPPA
ncbi:MAG: VOC family protein [Planctomycetaceae bacterium]|nr:VOC family protein [Planctomycetaceae bacterium]